MLFMKAAEREETTSVMFWPVGDGFEFFSYSSGCTYGEKTALVEERRVHLSGALVVLRVIQFSLRCALPGQHAILLMPPCFAETAA